MLDPVVPHRLARATLTEVAELVAAGWTCCVPDTEVWPDPSADDGLCKWVEHDPGCPEAILLIPDSPAFDPTRATTN
jgi:hypothetical protein